MAAENKVALHPEFGAKNSGRGLWWAFQNSLKLGAFVAVLAILLSGDMWRVSEDLVRLLKEVVITTPIAFLLLLSIGQGMVDKRIHRSQSEVLLHGCVGLLVAALVIYIPLLVFNTIPGIFSASYSYKVDPYGVRPKFDPRLIVETVVFILGLIAGLAPRGRFGVPWADKFVGQAIWKCGLYGAGVGALMGAGWFCFAFASQRFINHNIMNDNQGRIIACLLALPIKTACAGCITAVPISYLCVRLLTESAWDRVIARVGWGGLSGALLAFAVGCWHAVYYGMRWMAFSTSFGTSNPISNFLAEMMTWMTGNFIPAGMFLGAFVASVQAIRKFKLYIPNN